MKEAATLFCVGVTKGGTSSLYRALHDHPQCSIRSVKELHYYDTFDVTARNAQIKIFEKKLAEFETELIGNLTSGKKTWQNPFLERRILDMKSLISVIAGDRTGDIRFQRYLVGLRTKEDLVADVTPSYSICSEATLSRMLENNPNCKVLILIRDPLSRLWSHIRMHTQRTLQLEKSFEDSANSMLRRILYDNEAAQITDRGDYSAIITRFRSIFSPSQLGIFYTEEMNFPSGWKLICEFLGIDHALSSDMLVTHVGKSAKMDEDLREKAIKYLSHNYEWVNKHIGKPPPAWSESTIRAGRLDS